MNEDIYLAGQIERALQEDDRTHELGVRVEVTAGTVVLRGEVAAAERRWLIGEVAGDAAPGRTVRNEISVTEIAPADVPEVLPLPEEVMPVREVPPPRSFAPDGNNHGWSS
jgi:BON domain